MNTKHLTSALVLGSSLLALSQQAYSALITFENTQLPGLVEGNQVQTQYNTAAYNFVTFTSPDVGQGSTGPYLGLTGAPAVGWLYDATGQADTYAPGQGAANGSQFITDYVGGNPTHTSVLQADYGTPVNALSFDLIDVDGIEFANPESYTIEIFQAGDLVNPYQIQTLASGDPGTGDGVVSTIGFSTPGVDIVRLIVTGTKASGGFGLAFDNFNTNVDVTNPGADPIPAPATLALLGAGFIGWAGFRRRFSKK